MQTTDIENLIRKGALQAIIRHLSPDQCHRAAQDLQHVGQAVEAHLQTASSPANPAAEKTKEVLEAAALRALREIQDQLQKQAHR